MMTLQELFDQILPRLPGPALCSIFEAAREVQGIIANRLLLKRSELLVRESDAQLTFAAEAGKKTLPEDFWGFSSRPYLADGTPLSPLAGRSTQALQESGTPKYYQVAGLTLSIWPKPAAETVVFVPYFFRPEIPTLLTDELPFYGEFDSVFVEGCVAVLAGGLSVVADRAFVAVIQSQVDAVLEAKAMAAEQLLADAINDGQM